jgi:hypothetical protein
MSYSTQPQHAQPLPYAPLDERAAYGPLPHSRVGVAAFGLSLVTLLGVVLTLALVVAVTVKARGQGGSVSMDDPRLDGMLCSGVLTVVAAVVAFLLGLLGCNRKDRSKRFGLLGVLLSALALLVLFLTFLFSEPIVVYRTAPYGMLGL